MIFENLQELPMSMPASSVSKLKGTGYNQVTMPNKTPQQMEMFNMMYGGGKGGMEAGLQHLSQMAGGGNEEYWNQLEAPAMRQFGEMQGNIASRFSGAGMGGRRSSGFQNAQNSAASELSQQLQSNRLGLQNQAIQQLMSMYGNLMGQDMNTTSLIPKKKKWWQELLPSLAGGIGEGAAQFGTMGAGNALGLFK